MTMLGQLGVTVDVKDQSSGDMDAAIVSLLKTYGWTIAGGTGTNQADLAWSDERTLAASATEDLDVSGSLTSKFGAFVAAKVKAIIVSAHPSNTNDVQVTRPSANGLPFFIAAGDGVAVKPGGLFALWSPGAGYTVTAATGDLLTVTNSAGGTPVTYRVILLGTSA